MNNKVIITADDYGVCNAIDHAIIEAIRAQKLTAVSAIVTHETSLKRIEKLVAIQQEEKAKGNHFGIGLHFCITSGNPFYKVSETLPSSLADPNDEKGRFREAAYYKFRDIEMHHLRQELNMQFDAISQVMERKDIDHLTNHHGIVYFDEEMYNEYIQTAATWKVPIRSPMSWYRKFKKFGDLPDYDKHDIGNPTMRRGLKLGMWRKLSQMSYGNFLKRMNTAEELLVNYPDVLCEFIYGQCSEEINKGPEVLEHCMNKFIKRKPKYTVLNAHQFTVKKGRSGDMDMLVKRYNETLKEEGLSFEFMFHLAALASDVKDLIDIPDDPKPHGINLEYFDTRQRELTTLKGFDRKRYEKDYQIGFVPFKAL